MEICSYIDESDFRIFFRVFKIFFSIFQKSQVYDESFGTVTELQQAKQLVPNIEFGRRMAMERDLERTDSASCLGNALFDETGNFLIYPTPLGVKVVNLVTNNCVRWIGKPENVRFLCLGLFQVGGISEFFFLG